MKTSVFAADLRVHGDVTSKGDLDVHGHIEGSVGVKNLTVARGASIEGQVRAASASIAGRMTGQIESERVAIESSGSVEGDVSYKTLSMVVGGVLNARCIPTQGSVTAAAPRSTPASADKPRASPATARRLAVTAPA